MKITDIEAKMSAKVATYLSEGYVLYTPAMNGTQGEYSKVALCKDGKVVLIYLATEYNNLSIRYSSEILTLNVKVHDEHTRSSNQVSSFHTYWLDEGVFLEKEYFYKVGLNWFVTVDEMKDVSAIRELRNERRGLDADTRDLRRTSEEVKSIVLPFIRRQHMCKTKKLSDIVAVTRTVRYKGVGKDYKRCFSYQIALANNKYFTLKASV